LPQSGSPSFVWLGRLIRFGGAAALQCPV
jgi:hypothetical protein